MQQGSKQYKLIIRKYTVNQRLVCRITLDKSPINHLIYHNKLLIFSKTVFFGRTSLLSFMLSSPSSFVDSPVLINFITKFAPINPANPVMRMVLFVNSKWFKTALPFYLFIVLFTLSINLSLLCFFIYSLKYDSCKSAQKHLTLR